MKLMNTFAPGYWMHETSGVLRPAVEAYLSGRVLNDAEIGIMRDYLSQWMTQGDWKGSDVEVLIVALPALRTREDLERWLAAADKRGIDPL